MVNIWRGKVDGAIDSTRHLNRCTNVTFQLEVDVTRVGCDIAISCVLKRQSGLGMQCMRAVGFTEVKMCSYSQ